VFVLWDGNSLGGIVVGLPLRRSANCMESVYDLDQPLALRATSIDKLPVLVSQGIEMTGIPDG